MPVKVSYNLNSMQKISTISSNRMFRKIIHSIEYKTFENKLITKTIEYKTNGCPIF